MSVSRLERRKVKSAAYYAKKKALTQKIAAAQKSAESSEAQGPQVFWLLNSSRCVIMKENKEVC